MTEIHACPLTGCQPQNEQLRSLTLCVSLSGFCRNLADELEERGMKRKLAGEIGLLREIAKHACETAAGEHTLEEFGAFYCLVEKESAS